MQHSYFTSVRNFKNEISKRTFRQNAAYILSLKGDSHWLALSFACGVFIGISPFYGAHTVGALVIVSIFRFNLMTTMLGAWLTFPPTLPFIYYFCYRLGRLFLHDATCIPRSRLFETIDKIMHFNVAGLGLESRDVILIAKQLLLGCTDLWSFLFSWRLLHAALCDRSPPFQNPQVTWFGKMICPYGKIREIRHNSRHRITDREWIFTATVFRRGMGDE